MIDTIEIKISELFEYRMLPWMIEQCDISHGETQFLQELTDLQYDIFLYDKELEAHWELDLDKLGELWTDIVERLISKGFCENSRSAESYLKEIKVYASNEMAMRDSQALADLPIDTFYYFKSCDVRLMRRLILETCQLNDDAKELCLENWKNFDLITEVNDDVCDLQEDLATWNGNRWKSCLQEIGIKAAGKQYLEFLDDIQHALENEPHSGDLVGQINEKANLELNRTRSLILETLKDEKVIKLLCQTSSNERIN